MPKFNVVTSQVTFLVPEEVQRWQIEKAIAEGASRIGEQIGSVRNGYTEVEYANHEPTFEELIVNIFSAWQESRDRK